MIQERSDETGQQQPAVVLAHAATELQPVHKWTSELQPNAHLATWGSCIPFPTSYKDIKKTDLCELCWFPGGGTPHGNPWLRIFLCCKVQKASFDYTLTYCFFPLYTHTHIYTSRYM